MHDLLLVALGRVEEPVEEIIAEEIPEGIRSKIRTGSSMCVTCSLMIGTTAGLTFAAADSKATLNWLRSSFPWVDDLGGGGSGGDGLLSREERHRRR